MAKTKAQSTNSAKNFPIEGNIEENLSTFSAANEKKQFKYYAYNRERGSEGAYVGNNMQSAKEVFVASPKAKQKLEEEKLMAKAKAINFVLRGTIREIWSIIKNPHS